MTAEIPSTYLSSELGDFQPMHEIDPANPRLVVAALSRNLSLIRAKEAPGEADVTAA